jgi:hypothetical protein
MSSWEALARELDSWQAAGRRASLWWRDDDAVESTPALERLLAIAGSWRVPLALATVPLLAQASLVAALRDAPGVAALPHGFRHLNHSPAGVKSGELGPARALDVNLREVDLGWRRLETLFGGRALPVLVPPWNRIDAALVPHLPALGFRGLSAWGARAAAWAAPGLWQVNTHLDIIDWRGGRGFVGEAKALAVLVGHLAARRRNEVDADEPSGLLTHHLVHDAAGWRFIETLFARMAEHPAARWLDAETIFPPAKAELPSVAAEGG